MRLVGQALRRPNVALGILLGMCAATLTSAVAAAVYMSRGSMPAGGGLGLPALVGVYWVAGIAGGALFGLLLPLTTWRWGSVLVGMSVLAPAYWGVDLLSTEHDLLPGMSAAILVGGIAGYALWTPVKANRNEVR